MRIYKYILLILLSLTACDNGRENTCIEPANFGNLQINKTKVYAKPSADPETPVDKPHKACPSQHNNQWTDSGVEIKVIDSKLKMTASGIADFCGSNTVVNCPDGQNSTSCTIVTDSTDCNEAITSLSGNGNSSSAGRTTPPSYMPITPVACSNTVNISVGDVLTVTIPAQSGESNRHSLNATASGDCTSDGERECWHSGGSGIEVKVGSSDPILLSDTSHFTKTVNLNAATYTMTNNTEFSGLVTLRTYEDPLYIGRRSCSTGLDAFGICAGVWNRWNHYLHSDNLGSYTGIVISTDKTCLGGRDRVRARIDDGTSSIEFSPFLDTEIYKEFPQMLGRLYFRLEDKEVGEAARKECDFTAAELASKYVDNKGSVTIKPVAAEEGFVGSLVDIMEAPFSRIFSEDFSRDYFNHLVGEGSLFQTLLKLSLALYVTFTAFGFFIGLVNITQSEIYNRILKVVLILGFVSPTSWNLFNQFVIQFFEQGSLSVAQVLYGGVANLAPENVNPYAIFSEIVAVLFEPEIHYKILGVLFSPFLIGFIYVYWIYYAFFFILVAIGKSLILYFTIKLVMHMLFFLGPIFIVFALFGYTRGLFDRWLGIVISYALQMILLYVTLAFFGYMIMAVIYDTFGYGVCWGPVWSITLPGTTNEIEVFSFWRVWGYSPKYSPGYNVSQGASFVQILFLIALAYLFREFISKVTDLADRMSSGVGGGGSSASAMAGGMMKAAGQAMEAIGDGIESLDKGTLGIGKRMRRAGRAVDDKLFSYSSRTRNFDYQVGRATDKILADASKSAKKKGLTGQAKHDHVDKMLKRKLGAMGASESRIKRVLGSRKYQNTLRENTRYSSKEAFDMIKSGRASKEQMAADFQHDDKIENAQIRLKVNKDSFFANTRAGAEEAERKNENKAWGGIKGALIGDKRKKPRIDAEFSPGKKAARGIMGNNAQNRMRNLALRLADDEKGESSMVPKRLRGRFGDKAEEVEAKLSEISGEEQKAKEEKEKAIEENEHIEHEREDDKPEHEEEVQLDENKTDSDAMDAAVEKAAKRGRLNSKANQLAGRIEQLKQKIDKNPNDQQLVQELKGLEVEKASVEQEKSLVE